MSYRTNDLRDQYFSNVLKKVSIDTIIDPVTGAISRKYFFEYVKYLIKNHTNFTYGSIDLDNFKDINDNYGHQVGDEILKVVSDNFIKYFKDSGIFARIGGDEFAFVYFKETEYDPMHAVLEDIMYGKIFRRYYKIKDFDIFLTGTIGCVAYPRNAINYADLISKADKALYRGKEKGRNCFILWVDEKHKNLKISKLVKVDVYSIVTRLTRNLDNYYLDKSEFRKSFNFLSNNLKINYIFYIKDNKLYDGSLNMIIGNVEIDDSKFNDDYLFSSNFNKDIIENEPSLAKLLESKKIESILILKNHRSFDKIQYIMYAETRSSRIWQVEEKAILFCYLRLLNNILEKENS